VAPVCSSHRSLTLVLLLALSALAPNIARAEKEIRIPAGQSVDAWWGVNVSGKINYTIRTRDGSNKAKFWWIKWGFGTVEEIGVRTDTGAIDIPISIFKGVAAAKLRASSDVDTVIYIRENSAPDAGVTFHW
jgi:hypothetical protein